MDDSGPFLSVGSNQLTDYLCWRLLRGGDAEPPACLVSRHKFLDTRDLGQTLKTRRGRHCQQAKHARPTIVEGRSRSREHHLHLPAKEIGQRRSFAEIRDMKHLYSRHLIEQLAEQMMWRT